MFNKKEISAEMDILLDKAIKQELTDSEMARIEELGKILRKQPYPEVSKLWEKEVLLIGSKLLFEQKITLAQIKEKFTAFFRKVSEDGKLTEAESKEFDDLCFMLATFQETSPHEYERIMRFEAKIKDISRKNDLTDSLMEIFK
jgi:hypothetical protein